MKNLPRFFVILLAASAGWLVFLVTSCRETTTVTNLRCEYRQSPLGIEWSRPRFSWEEISKKHNQRQTAYQIVVVGRWDSGRIQSDQSSGVEYDGPPLKPGAAYTWKVRIWDAEGSPTPWSWPATFSTGLGQWHAAWIAHDTTPPESAYNTKGLFWVTAKNKKLGPMSLSKQIDLPAGRKVKKAVLVLFPDNSCAASVNSQAVGNAVRWDRTANLDVTKLLHPGNNTIALKVTNSDGLPASVIGRLAVEFDSGQDLDLPIDASWGSVDLSIKTPWGTPALNDQLRVPASYFRKEFTVPREVRRATATVAALGSYELRLNGRKVGDDVLAPGWTDFHKRAYFQTYDITSMIHQGVNTVAAILGDGWYASNLAFTGRQNYYGGKPKLKIELSVEYVDGSVEDVSSDSTWKASTGPLRSADILLGCDFDARLEMQGWDQPGFEDDRWVAATAPCNDSEAPPHQPLLLPAVSDPPHVQELLPTIKVTEPMPNISIFDLGQNMSGWAKLRLRGSVGQCITVRYGEFLNPDGSLYTANLRGATSTDRFTLNGTEEVDLEPSFTYHGFRYVEVRGLNKKPDPLMVTGVVIHSPMERTGWFECSSPLLNQLYHNIIWGQKSNYIDVPSDCPQRDERAGWTGDAEFFIPTAACNFNIDPFFTKWLTTLCEDSQHADGSIAHVAPDLGLGSGATAWGDAAVICTYQIWHTYDDTRVIRSHFPALEKFMDWFATKSTNGIPNVGGFGDWLNKGGGASREVIDTAYYANDARMMAEMAQAVGKNEAAVKYTRIHEQTKQTFAGFFEPDGTLRGCSQTGYALAFGMGLVPDDLREKAAVKFAGEIKKFDNHLATGFIGTPRLLPALHLAGLDDLAYALLLQETYPSWLFPVKLGATTMWERWDGWTPEKGFQSVGMNSFNHYAFGAVGEYLYSMVLGIRAESPGYKTIRIQPVVGKGLTWAKGGIQTIYGYVGSYWRVDAGYLILEVTIPPNTTAEVLVPGGNAHSAGLTAVSSSKEGSLFRIGSGNYTFESVPNIPK